MSARGRHRRRRRGRALRAVLTGAALGLTAAATMISASQATVGSDPGGLKPLTSASDLGQLQVRETLEPQQSLDRLASAMGRPVGVDAVLKSADHTLRDAADCTTDEKAALPVEPAATRAYCWDSGDAADPGWTPRSVTTSGDADEDGWWGSNRVILSGWSANTRGLARVAFVNAADPARLTYTWALLAVPTDGGRDYRGLASTVSGMVWYQDKLLVTTTGGTRDALYVYDMNRIQRTTVTASAVGRVREGWSAAGYRYVLPAVGSYRLSGDKSAVRPVGLSLDRSTVPDSLVASGAKRLWRYPFSRDPARTGLLATDSAGRAVPEEAYATKVTGVGGVLASGSSWYLGGAAGEQSGHGSLWRQDAKDAKATECGADETHQCWSAQTGSLSYWQETGEVWSVSGRMLFALPLNSIDSSLG
ncbi:hypothetical protein JHN63_13470 [Streptomyces sp. MBT65]|uniref:hypothetical protein n=1 Tax=Streptomyces sp. MBT65 TaxID=1488395 RepID=UPI001909ECF2|nr:hypothetical protein [Streptomyces sp. MBT65]MBK3574805.1 hypothetical protein [Streptomyces sp. MBT65]